ncbi:unnamed protein product [Dracunculus medinensis]|uniref:Uncharacterized protein n=1 Tax=Dracunculus medinensis TaxID=318479 RepID=A0A3P7PXX7_DRAME|nr:unnamed protein product [Dracunculus medinensis]
MIAFNLFYVITTFYVPLIIFIISKPCNIFDTNPVFKKSMAIIGTFLITYRLHN